MNSSIIKEVISLKINKYLDWFIHMIGYTLVLIFVSIFFKKTVYIDNSFFGIWGFLAVVLIFIFNRTIKPLLVWMTLPLTALTLGLFYPVINMIILKLTSLILNNHFRIHGVLMLFVFSIVISIMNAIMDNIIIDGIIKGRNK